MSSIRVHSLKKAGLKDLRPRNVEFVRNKRINWTWKWINDLLRAFPDPAGIIPTGNSRLLLQSDLEIKFTDIGIKFKYLYQNLVFSKKSANTKSVEIITIYNYFTRKLRKFYFTPRPHFGCWLSNIYNLAKKKKYKILLAFEMKMRGFFLSQKLHVK